MSVRNSRFMLEISPVGKFEELVICRAAVLGGDFFDANSRYFLRADFQRGWAEALYLLDNSHCTHLEWSAIYSRMCVLVLVPGPIRVLVRKWYESFGKKVQTRAR